MADRTSIEWTDATVNFWWGCTKVGPGCDHCYAESLDKRVGGAHWGTGAPRRKIKSAVATIHRLDNDYSRWAADASIASLHPNSRRRVFIQSMSDLFDNEVPINWFADAWAKIKTCNRIDIQIVTKRISIVEKRLAAIGEGPWPAHAGLMITVVNQAEADRDVPRLLALKAKLGIPWVGLSMEPLLGLVDLTRIATMQFSGAEAINALSGHGLDIFGKKTRKLPGLDWVICGGESGPGARVWPGFEDAARSLRDQCRAAGVAFFMKQMAGARKASMPPIPDDLMVREFPDV
jgi:protein gp37